MGLLFDQDFSLGAWQPGWLLVVPALAALVARPPRGFSTLALPLLAGWLVATVAANTMHGWWWPGRQTVVVVPLALLTVLCWLARTGTAMRAVAAVLGLAGVSTYATLLGRRVSQEDRLGLRLHPRRRAVLPNATPAATSLPGRHRTPGLGGGARPARRYGLARRTPAVYQAQLT